MVVVGNGCSQGGFQNFTGVLERTKTILRKSEGQFFGNTNGRSTFFFGEFVVKRSHRG